MKLQEIKEKAVKEALVCAIHDAHSEQKELIRQLLDLSNPQRQGQNSISRFHQLQQLIDEAFYELCELFDRKPTVTE